VELVDTRDLKRGECHISLSDLIPKSPEIRAFSHCAFPAYTVLSAFVLRHPVPIAVPKRKGAL
jgi:hypothetical protein